MLGPLVPPAPQVYQGKPVQAWRDPPGRQGFPVIPESRGKQAFLPDLIWLRGNRGARGHRACREHQDVRGLRAQMLYIVVLGIPDHQE